MALAAPVCVSRELRARIDAYLILILLILSAIVVAAAFALATRQR
jgi:hypothetical protein